MRDLQKAIKEYRAALKHYTLEADPLGYAEIQYKLGFACAKLPVGDPERNLQQAIDCFREALRVFTLETSPADYANSYYNLGLAYSKLTSGDRARNLQQSIDCYREALRFWKPDTAPLDYALTLNNLGCNFCEMPSDDRAEYLQQAMDSYREALRFYSFEASPHDFARTLCNLGKTYVDLLAGNRTDNLNQAIECYREALRVYTIDADPINYASTQRRLGLAYADLPTGDEIQNLRQAIDCFQEALRVYTPEFAPLDFAKTQCFLGMTFADLSTGNWNYNLEYAVNCYREALRFLTPETDLSGYVNCQNVLGNAYYKWSWYDRAHLGQSVNCFREALHFCTPETSPMQYAMIQNNLGRAYTALLDGDRTRNLEQAVDCLHEALRFYTREANPEQYATTQYNLGRIYAQCPTGDWTRDREQSVDCYRHALSVFTRETAPDEHCGMVADLGNLHFGEHKWAKAHSAYSSAISAGELLYQAAATEVARQAQFSILGHIIRDDAYCLARLGRFTEATERLESGRARTLAEALALNRTSLQQIKLEDQIAFEAARNRIKALELEARAGAAWTFDPSAPRRFSRISSDLSAARRDLIQTIVRIRAYLPDFMATKPDFKAITNSPTQARPIVYLITTTQGSLGLIVPAMTDQLNSKHAVWLDKFDSDILYALLSQVNSRGKAVYRYLEGQSGGNMNVLKGALDGILPILRDSLADPLATRLAEMGFQQATLIPGGMLGILPLHAAAIEVANFSYAPSALAVGMSTQKVRERLVQPPVVFGVGNPLPAATPLPFARAEVETIISLFDTQSRRTLYEYDATRVRTLEKIPGATHLHFACHGRCGMIDPLQDALCLAGEDKVTLRDLLDDDLDLSSSRLAVLSACQTGTTEFLKAPDEAIGLSTGLLQAGVPGVISALWDVADLSAALLMERFYTFHLKDHLEPAMALHKAQLWLRNATAREMNLAARYEKAYKTSGRRDRNAYECMRYYQARPDVKPFVHPYYWAAFAFHGA